MTLVIVIVVLLLTLAFFYLKCSLLQAIMTLWSAILATIIAFSYYEWVANLLISRGKGLDWVLGVAFVLLFIISFAVLRAVSDLLMPGKVDLGDLPKLSVSLTCGFLTGLVISGNLLITLGFVPLHGKIFYSRFDPDPEASVVLNSPNKPALGMDGFIAGLYSWVSSGSMSSSKSFGVLHADYLTQIHLNKLKTEESVLSVCSPESLVLPSGKAKKPVRRRTVDDKQVVIVRVGVKANKIEDGGAGNEFNKLEFFPGQIRMIVKGSETVNDALAGSAEAVYPVGLMKGGKVIELELNKTIAPDPKEMKRRIYWMDLVFKVPAGKKAVLLNFKQNALVQLPDTVDSTPEIERALDDEESNK